MAVAWVVYSVETANHAKGVLFSVVVVLVHTYTDTDYIIGDLSTVLFSVGSSAGVVGGESVSGRRVAVSTFKS